MFKSVVPYLRGPIPILCLLLFLLPADAAFGLVYVFGTLVVFAGVTRNLNLAANFLTITAILVAGCITYIAINDETEIVLMPDGSPRTVVARWRMLFQGEEFYRGQQALVSAAITKLQDAQTAGTEERVAAAIGPRNGVATAGEANNAESTNELHRLMKLRTGLQQQLQEKAH